MSTHTLAILFLPGFVGKLFGLDGIAAAHNLMHQLSMQALAMGSEFALGRCETATGGLVSSAVFPAKATLLDTPFLVIVLRVVGASLAVELPLEATFLVLVGLEFVTEGEQPSIALVWHYGNGGRPKVKTNGGC